MDKIKNIFEADADYTAIATSYLKYITYTNIDTSSSASSVSGVTLASDHASLRYLTKRSLLLYDKSIVTPVSSNKVQYDSGGGGSVVRYAYIDNLYKLGQFLSSTKELILSENLIVLPKLTRENSVTKTLRGPVWDPYSHSDFERYEHTREEVTNSIADAIINNNKVIEVNTVEAMKEKYIRALFELRIPLVDTSKMGEFSKIASDKHKELENLKFHLQKYILDIESKTDSEFFLSEIENISISLKNDLELLEKDIKILSIQNAFKLSGAFLSTLVATLVVIDTKLLADVKMITGLSGGAYLFIDALRDGAIGKIDTENNPMYFLWLLDKANG